ncbi:MAG: NHL repeat-containing protein [Verrucomicrobiae bacterium]|nr:NHL repeat-containing protein [Verrucomicrobiae bacterium]
MKKKTQHSVRSELLLVLFLLGTSHTALSQRPQDNWYLLNTWTKTGVATNGGLSAPYGVAVGPDRRIYVGDQSLGCIQIYLPDGTFSSAITNGFGDGQSFSQPRGMIFDSLGNLYVADSGNNCVYLFSSNGSFVRKIGQGTGSGNGQLSGVVDVGVSGDGEVFVLESGNVRVSVFDTNGTFLRKWGGYGSLAGQLSSPYSIAVSPDGRVYICQVPFNQQGTDVKLKEFDRNGLYVRSTSNFEGIGDFGRSYAFWECGGSVRLDPSGQIHQLFGFWALYSTGAPNPDDSPYVIVRNRELVEQFRYSPQWIGPGNNDYHFPCHAIGPDGTMVLCTKSTKTLRIFKMTFRDQWIPPLNCIAIPGVWKTRQRPNSPLVDIDYQVTDADDTTVTVGALIFTNSSATPSLAACIRNPTFVEGTSSNLGPGITANEVHRLTWNAGADWSVNLGDYRVAILAQDSRTNLLDIHYLSLPADNGMPALKISRSPVGTADFMQVWWWLLATGDPGITLASNQIFGVSGTYAAQQFCTNGTTTPLGRTYVFEKMHAREATAQEVQWAKQGNMPAGSSPNQWSPGRTVAGRPSKVNEWGFDTGTWDTNAWKWVVPLP